MVFLIRWLLGLAFWCFFMRVLFKIYDGIYYVLFDSSYDLLDRGFYSLLLLLVFLIACFIYKRVMRMIFQNNIQKKKE